MNVYLMFSLLLDLMRHEKITAKFVAEKLELSTRTIYRYVDSLSANGVPVSTSTGRNGGIFLTQKYDLNSIYFTDDDLKLMCGLLKNSTDPNASFVMQKLLLIGDYRKNLQKTTMSSETKQVVDFSQKFF